MGEALPDPLVPSEVDLRDFAFMPLDVLRLRDSDLATLATGEEFKAAVMLWCTAWHQVPAASVPKDERWLARHSGAGQNWKKVREEALRGFVECSDGRLYHQVVAEKALESWGRKLEQRAKTLKARIAGIKKRLTEAVTDEEKEHLSGLLQTLSQSLSQAYSDSVTKPVTWSVTESVTTSKGTEHKGTIRDRDSKGTGTGNAFKPISSAVNSTSVGTADTDRAASDSKDKVKATQEGEWAADLKRRGISVTSAHPTLLAWISDGFTLPQVIEAIGIARDRKPSPEQIPANYLDRILRDPPKRSEEAWWSDDVRTMAKAKEYGVSTYGKQKEQLRQDIFAAIEKRKRESSDVAQQRHDEAA